MSEELGFVQVTSLEVVRPSPEQRDRWKSLTNDVRDMTNYIWQQWLCYHIENKTRDKIVAYLRNLDQWKGNGKVGAKPLGPSSGDCIPPALDKKIRNGLRDQWPHVLDRSKSLQFNRVKAAIKDRKSAKGSLSGWWAILLYHESIPSSTRGVPVPFDTRNGKLLPPEKDGEHFRLELRIERTDGKSIYDTVHIWSKGRKAAGQVAILRKILSGKAKFCGSNIVQRNDGKWYVNICWRAEKQALPKLDPTQVAALRPCVKVPWKLKIPGRNRRPGGMGRVVEHVRKQLLTSRWSRAEAYRNASSSRKGRGRDRAIDPTTKFQMRWRDFVRTFNQQVTADVVEQCVSAGVGRLIYFQPVGNADSRFLARSGKIEGRRDSTGWDWHQVAAFLSYKCERAGIAFEVRKSCEATRGKGDCEEPAKKTTRKPKNDPPMR